MNDTIQRKVTAVAFLALVLGAPLVANAGHDYISGADGKLHVSFVDLNLHSDAGVAILYKRLQAASKSTCGQDHHGSNLSLKETRDMRACVDKVLSRSVVKVGNAKLTAVHES